MKKASFLIFSFLILPIAGSVIINSTKAQWTGPSGPPTTYNVPAPLHIGDTNQTKKGGLTLGKDLWLDNFVSGAAQAGIKFFSNDSTFPRAGYLYNNAGTLIYQTDDGQGNQIPRFSIGNDGNVTIGNIQNQAKLHVDGDIRARNIYQNGKLVLTSETDPQVGILATNAFCTSDGNKINCTTATIPETDPTIGTLNPNNWCISDGSKITCNASPPVTKEQDPEVGVLVSGKYCKATTAPDGTKRIDCSSDLQASDPRIGTLVAGNVCTSPTGSYIECTSTGGGGGYYRSSIQNFKFLNNYKTAIFNSAITRGNMQVDANGVVYSTYNGPFVYWVNVWMNKLDPCKSVDLLVTDKNGNWLSLITINLDDSKRQTFSTTAPSSAGGIKLLYKKVSSGGCEPTNSLRLEVMAIPL